MSSTYTQYSIQHEKNPASGEIEFAIMFGNQHCGYGPTQLAADKIAQEIRAKRADCQTCFDYRQVRGAKDRLINCPTCSNPACTRCGGAGQVRSSGGASWSYVDCPLCFPAAGTPAENGAALRACGQPNPGDAVASGLRTMAEMGLPKSWQAETTPAEKPYWLDYDSPTMQEMRRQGRLESDLLYFEDAAMAHREYGAPLPTLKRPGGWPAEAIERLVAAGYPAATIEAATPAPVCHACGNEDGPNGCRECATPAPVQPIAPIKPRRKPAAKKPCCVFCAGEAATGVFFCATGGEFIALSNGKHIAAGPRQIQVQNKLNDYHYANLQHGADANGEQAADMVAAKAA